MTTKQIGSQHYRLNHRTLDYIQTREWSYSGLRLMHGLLHCLSRKTGNAHDVSGAMSETHRVRAATVRRQIGLSGTSDNRRLLTAIREISEKTPSVFELLSLEPHSRALEFKFSRRMNSESMVQQPGRRRDGTIIKPAAFGYFDINIVASCETLDDLLLYQQVALHRGRDQPMFRLHGVDRNKRGMRWSDQQKRVLRSACRIAAATDTRLLVGLEDDLVEFGVAAVWVKLTHADTKWSPGMLYKFSRDVRLIEITSDGHRYLTQAEADTKSRLARVPDLPPKMPGCADSASESSPMEMSDWDFRFGPAEPISPPANECHPARN
jgi:hypothetical protein